MEFRRKRNEDISNDWPTYSRLFIVTDRSFTENKMSDAFSKFGQIDDMYMPRDHTTNEPKGFIYIKFSKTSSAAHALEQMHMTTLPGSNRPLKVMVAAVRSEIQSDNDDDEKYKRLFINITKAENEDKLQEHFEQFGDIEDIQIQRNRETGESKGFAYIKFRKFSQAADAFENCDKKYRAIFAQPKSYSKRIETPFEHNIKNLATSSVQKSSIISMMNSRSEGYTRVNFVCSPYLTQHHVEMLFDLVPGMTDCKYFVDLMRNIGKGWVQYSNPISASYAVEKLNQFEYPPGMNIGVKPNTSKFNATEQNFNNIPNVVNNLKGVISSTANSATPDLAQLTEAIAEASKLIKTITAGVSEENVPDSSDLSYCSAKLPPPQPLADIDSKIEKRCFLVCKPQPPPLSVLRDIFCRFGDLVNVYTLPNKTVGYARYASVQAANEAIKTLHGAEVCGVRIKVLEAEEKPDDYDHNSKRTRH